MAWDVLSYIQNLQFSLTNKVLCLTGALFCLLTNFENNLDPDKARQNDTCRPDLDQSCLTF